MLFPFSIEICAIWILKKKTPKHIIFMGIASFCHLHIMMGKNHLS